MKYTTREYTLDAFVNEITSLGKNIRKDTVLKKLRGGEFGYIHWLSPDGEKFIARQNAIAEYMNRKRNAGRKKKPKKENKVMLMMPVHSEEEAQELACKKVNAELERKAKWTWGLDDDDLETAKQERIEFYKASLLSEYELQEVSRDEIYEEAKEYRKLPKDLLNYVSTYYKNKSEQDYFMERYMAYFRAYQFNLKDPKYDTIFRNAIDEELLMMELRCILRSPVGLTSDDVQKALVSATNRWKELLGSAGILLRPGKLDENTPPQKKAREEPEEEEIDPFEEGNRGQKIQ